MVAPVRRFLDIRRGEGLLVLLAFLDIAVIVAALLLARPIRNSLFLSEYGAYGLVYAYAAVPLVLTLFVPLYTRIAARVGIRRVTVGTLVFFALNVLAFWAAFRAYPVGDGATAPADASDAVVWLLPGAFYVWVNCFAVVAPVQAWSFANSLFDTRQAKRLFGLVGAGASLGAITGGVMARTLVGPVGGTVNMLLVLAALILLAAGIQRMAQARARGRGPARPRSQPALKFFESLRTIRRSRYLTLMAALVFVVAILTQWIAFQLSLAATERYGDDADALTAFFGTFTFTLGIVGLILQFVLTGPALRRFGIGVTILLLPLVLGFGSTLILLVPGFWMVLFTAGADQSLRFSVDKATYELLYLPLPQPQRGAVKAAIDIVVSRFADATGAVLLGLATQGFFMLGGLGFGLPGTAAVNIVLACAWAALAWRLRTEYVRTIEQTIHRHRMDHEASRVSPGAMLTSGIMRQRLFTGSTEDVMATLGMLEGQSLRKFQESLRWLLGHPAPEVRLRVLAMLSARGDKEIGGKAREMLRDPDIGVRTEALLYLSREHGADPLQVIEQLGDFADFSIRAGIAAYFAASNNPEAARALLAAMSTAPGPDGARERQEAARLLPRVPASLHDLLAPLILDRDTSVARQAIRSAMEVQEDDLIAPLFEALTREDLADDAAEALARYGLPIVQDVAARLGDTNTPAAIKRALPNVLVRIGSADAELVLIDSLLQPDAAVRHSIVVALNKLQTAPGRARIDPEFVELVLAAEIAGHYDAYRRLGELRERGGHDDPAIGALGQSMDQQLERIFRLMKLLLPHAAMHDAYIGMRSRIPAIRANALEFLENVLKPDLRKVVMPLVDSHVTLEERIARANQLVRGPLDGTEQAMATLLSSQDPWLRARAIHAVGALRLHDLAPALERMAVLADAATRSAIRMALHRLATEPEPEAPAPAEIGMGAGTG
jgi:ATP:ADP antiporter, AAA family